MLLRAFIAVTLLASSPTSAHELWIEPLEYQVEKGAEVQAHIRNGQEFEGTNLAFFKNRNTRLNAIFSDQTAEISGRMGDSPAIQTRAPDKDGLIVIVHEASPSKLIYREWEKFVAFAKHKDFPNAVADHNAAGWSKDLFRERYTRHSKSLIAVGNAKGNDRAAGLATEFVALTNPYAEGFDGQMKVALTYLNEPRSDAQVEVFDRAPSGDVSISLYRTDANGIASVPVSQGHTYLFDAVVLRPAPDAGSEDTAPVWETLWASLTFFVP